MYYFYHRKANYPYNKCQQDCDPFDLQNILMQIDSPCPNLFHFFFLQKTQGCSLLPDYNHQLGFSCTEKNQRQRFGSTKTKILLSLLQNNTQIK